MLTKLRRLNTDTKQLKNCVHFHDSAASVEPKRLAEIKVGKQDHGTAKIRRTSCDYGKIVLSQTRQQQPTSQQIMKLRGDLFKATQHLGVHVPAVHVLTPKNFPSDNPEPPQYVHCLPEQLSWSDPRLLPTIQVAVTSKPLPVALLPSEGMSVNEFMQSVHFSDEQRAEVERITRGQRETLEWYHQRMGSITSTKIHEIIKFCAGNKIDVNRLVKGVIGSQQQMTAVPRMPNKESLKWGIVNEGKARDMYCQMMSVSHENFDVHCPGLIVDSKSGFLRSSPDGIATCNCHPPRLLEIKCPYTARDEDFLALVKNPMIKYLKEIEGRICLQNSTSEGYLTQVQAGMAISGLATCDFVVYSAGNIGMLTVPFDKAYWEVLLPKLVNFFYCHVAPALVRKSVSSPEEPVNMSERIQIDEQTDEQATCHLPQAGPSSAPEVTAVIRCGSCRIVLPEADYIQEDNSNASIGCECTCGCESWHCWPCANYDQDMADDEIEWFCPTCVRGCDIIY